MCNRQCDKGGQFAGERVNYLHKRTIWIAISVDVVFIVDADNERVFVEGNLGILLAKAHNRIQVVCTGDEAEALLINTLFSAHSR